MRLDLAARFKGRAEVVATSLHGDPARGLGQLDVRDANAIASTLERLQPTHVVNLAALASPVIARKNPEISWTLHAHVPDMLGRLILRHVPECWLMQVGSGLVYGRTAMAGSAMTVDDVLAPMDLYAVTKAAGDLALGALAGEGLKCLRLRPFNHTGPGQASDFAVPSFAGQLARIAVGKQPPVFRAGNLEAERDFLDVRDVAAAYGCIIECSGALKTGSIYNIASGTAVRMGEILDCLIELAGVRVILESDPSKQRPADLPRISGDSSNLRRDTGWQPKYKLPDTLADTYFAALAEAEVN